MHLISGGQNYFFEGACGQNYCQKGSSLHEIQSYCIKKLLQVP